jgi:hypothetical protein
MRTTTFALCVYALLLTGCVRNTISEDRQAMEKLQKKVESLDREIGELKTNYFKIQFQHVEVLEGMEKRISTVEDNQVSADWMKDPKRVWQTLSNLEHYISYVEKHSVKKEATEK